MRTLKTAGFFIITVVGGYLGAAIVGNFMNWPDAGAVFAVAAAGAMLFHRLEGQDKNRD